MTNPIPVWAVCNNGVLKKVSELKRCLDKWAFMSWFHLINGGADIDWTAEAIGRRVLRVEGMERVMFVRVRRGRIVIEEAT